MEIIRTQVYLRKTQHRALSQEARRLGLSLTELIRRAIDQLLRHSVEFHAGPARGLAAITALGESSAPDGSARHDDYVYDAIQTQLDKSRKSPSP